MLSATEVRPAHRRRRSYSDKQHYQEYILQRIEGYKNSIGRDELLRLVLVVIHAVWVLRS